MANPFEYNVAGVTSLVEDDINKIKNSGMLSPEGVSSDKLDVLDLPMEDEKLLDLRDDWENAYAVYESKIKETFRRNLNSYLGRTKDGRYLDADQPGAANLQFEAEETFLPAALARNPDPIVYADDTPEGNKISDTVKTMLQAHADQLLLKRKLAVMARQWSIYQLGVLKHGWDKEVDDVCLDNRKVQDFVFDPNGFVDVYGHFSSWLGERIASTAQELVDLFPKYKTAIILEIGGLENLGTQVVRTEWWTDEFCFTTFKNKVLEKHKNEYFKYPEDQGEFDELGLPKLTEPRNHFAKPLKPYTFLSVFSLQERPHDITGLIEQNIPNQAKITKRVEQIDTNVSKSNNSEIFSEQNFNQETAKQAADAIRDPSRGQILIPAGGPIGEAIVRLPAPSFPDAAFKDLESSESHLRSSWGVQGIASQEQKPDTTARGMILNQGRDTSRIGGGISDIIEQSVARSVFNWLVQLYMVFYDERHFAAVMGVGKSVEYAQLQASDIDRQLIVGVAPNSMQPKDETTRANEAQELFAKGAIGPKTLLEALNFPNADEAAADGVLWQVDKMTYIQLNFPELAQQLQQAAQQQMVLQQQAQAQQMAQEAQGFQQKQGMEQAAHQQKLQQGQEIHEAKLGNFKDMASAKLAQQKQSVPK